MSVNECINMKYYIINDPQNLFTKLKITFILSLIFWDHFPLFKQLEHEGALIFSALISSMILFSDPTKTLDSS